MGELGMGGRCERKRQSPARSAEVGELHLSLGDTKDAPRPGMRDIWMGSEEWSKNIGKGRQVVKLPLRGRPPLWGPWGRGMRGIPVAGAC